MRRITLCVEGEAGLKLAVPAAYPGSLRFTAAASAD
jgi:hypothetical protein